MGCENEKADDLIANFMYTEFMLCADLVLENKEGRLIFALNTWR